MSNQENHKGTFTHNETRDEIPSLVRHLTIHPDFFEKTAEEQAEQDELAQRKFQTEQTLFVQDEFQELFNDEDFFVPPHWLMNRAPHFYLAPTGKVAPNTVLIDPTDTPTNLKWANESETIEPISRSSVELPENSFGIAGDTIRELMQKRLRVHLSEKPATLSYRVHQGGRDYIAYLKEQ